MNKKIRNYKNKLFSVVVQFQKSKNSLFIVVTCLYFKSWFLLTTEYKTIMYIV